MRLLKIKTVYRFINDYIYLVGLLKKAILLLMLSPILLSASEDVFDKPTFHVCTIASDYTPELEQLLDSCQRYGVNIEILGLHQPYPNNCIKIKRVKDFIENLPDNDIVMLVDGYDVLFQASPEKILNLFFGMEVPFVIAVERLTWPYHSKRSLFPPSPTSFKYINSGSYIGYVSHIKHIFSELKTKWHNSDQGVFYNHFFDHPEQYTFDYHCQLFLAMSDMRKEELVFDDINNVVKCKETDTTPCIIHGPGHYRALYQMAYDRFYKNEKPKSGSKVKK